MVRFAGAALSGIALVGFAVAGIASAGLVHAQTPVEAPAATPSAPPPASATIRAGDEVVLSPGEWRCISSRLDRFAASESSRIIIPVLDCPAAQDGAPSAPSESRGLSLDFQATRGLSARRAYRGLLIVSREELSCLITLRDAEVAAAPAPGARTRSAAAPPEAAVTLDLAAAKCRAPARRP